MNHRLEMILNTSQAETAAEKTARSASHLRSEVSKLWIKMKFESTDQSKEYEHRETTVSF